MRLVEYYSVIDKDIQVKIIDCANQKVLYEGGITTPYNDLDDTLMNKNVIKISASYMAKQKDTSIMANTPFNVIDVIIPILDIYIDTRTAIEIFIINLFNKISRKHITEFNKEVFIQFNFVNGLNNNTIFITDTIRFDDRDQIISSEEYKKLLDVYGDNKFDCEIMAIRPEILDGNLEYKNDNGKTTYRINIKFNDFKEDN